MKGWFAVSDAMIVDQIDVPRQPVTDNGGQAILDASTIDRIGLRWTNEE